MNLNIKVTKILYYRFLLLDQFRFGETHFTTHPRFVADGSAISPFLGGYVVARNNSTMGVDSTGGCQREVVNGGLSFGARKIVNM